MATSAFLRRAWPLAATLALAFAASPALAQGKIDLNKLQASDIDFSKLKKNDPLEIKLGDKWVLGAYRSNNNGKIIWVRVDKVDHMAFPNMVRLPAPGKVAAPPQERTWTDRSGKFKLLAALVKVEGEKVLLKRKSDGKEIAVALEKLSEADHKYLKSLATAKVDAPPADATTAASGEPNAPPAAPAPAAPAPAASP